MSICDEIQKLVADREATLFDASVCEMYEEASKSFQELVDKGFAYKRGYQLLPIESTVCNNVDFNVSRT